MQYETSAQTLLVVILVILGVGCLLFLWRYLAVNVLNPTGKGAHRSTTGTLKKYALIRSFKVLTDVNLELNGKTAVVENMLIGFFGILIIHTCGARGEYYGTVEGDNWIITEEGKRSTIPNPLKNQQQAMAIMRGLLSKEKLYNIPIQNVVVLTNRAKKSAFYITNSGEILMPGKLGGYLDKTKFDKDIGLDVAKIAAVLQGNTPKQ